MVVRIRLARFGKRHAPFYNIVVAQARSARNSKPMEVIGTYDPIPKEPREGESNRWKDVKLDVARAKYWLGVGAQPSDPAWRLLAMIGLLEPKYRPAGMRDEPAASMGITARTSGSNDSPLSKISTTATTTTNTSIPLSTMTTTTTTAAVAAATSQPSTATPPPS